MRTAVVTGFCVLLCAGGARSQSGSEVQFGPVAPVIALLVAMAVSVLVVALLLCQFVWSRNAARQRRRGLQRPLGDSSRSSSSQATTTPKGRSAATVAKQYAVPQLQQQYVEVHEEVQQQQQEPVQYVEVHEEVRQQQQQQQQQQSSSSLVSAESVRLQATMRDTASEFLEFLSRKWQMEVRGHEQHDHEQHDHEQHDHEQHDHEQHDHEQHDHEQHDHEQQQQQQQQQEEEEDELPQERSTLTTFQAADGGSSRQQFAFSEFFDICEEEEAQSDEQATVYDNASETNAEDIHLTLKSQLAVRQDEASVAL